MNKFDLTEAEDMQLRLSIKLPGGRFLYEYFCELPLKDLEAYPKKGFYWWMGRAARSSPALALRDYILHWRLIAVSFRQQYPRTYLETLSSDDLRLFLRTYINKTPIWPYEEPVKDVLQLLSRQS